MKSYCRKFISPFSRSILFSVQNCEQQKLFFSFLHFVRNEHILNRNLKNIKKTNCATNNRLQNNNSVSNEIVLKTWYTLKALSWTRELNIQKIFKLPFTFQYFNVKYKETCTLISQ